ncbi:MAG: hypothetical protein WC654_04255 [Patescibacteria group bacterium]
MNDKEFTARQVYILVFAIVVGIAFIETRAGAIWTSVFWKEFLLKVIVYGAIVEFVVVLISSFQRNH